MFLNVLDNVGQSTGAHIGVAPSQILKPSQLCWPWGFHGACETMITYSLLCQYPNLMLMLSLLKCRCQTCRSCLAETFAWGLCTGAQHAWRQESSVWESILWHVSVASCQPLLHMPEALGLDSITEPNSQSNLLHDMLCMDSEHTEHAHMPEAWLAWNTCPQFTQHWHGEFGHPTKPQKF